MVINKLFKELRVRSGLTQEEVAKIIGISRRNYIEFELSRSMLELGRINKLEELYQMTLVDGKLKVKGAKKDAICKKQ